jgi:AcrR family transcriptional regulator
MARPQQISNQQILSTTKRCVLERGAQVPLDYVAKQLGVTGPALLKRFQSRQELLLQALLPSVPDWFATLEEGPQRDAFEPQVEALLHQMWVFFLEVMPCMSALRESDIPHHVVEERLKTPIWARVILTDWLKRAAKLKLIATVPFESAAGMLLGAMQNRSFTMHLGKENISVKERDRFVSEVAQLFCSAVGATKKRVRT